MKNKFFILGFPRKYTKDQLKLQVEVIMQDFDFENVHRIMKFLNWKWATSDGMKVPSIENMKKTAQELLDDVVEESAKTPEHNYIETGGFRASYSNINGMSLQFIAEQAESYEE